jgi:peptidoglycan/xylan/chitin deacetylase (PgdA/CDA1 family)
MGPLNGPARRVVFGALWLTGLPWALRSIQQKRGLTVLCLHKPDPAHFSKLAEALAKRYTFVSLSDLLGCIDAGSFDGLPSWPLLLTLDDGAVSNLDLVPVFRRLGIRPTLFVCTGIVGTRRGFWWSHIPESDAERLKELPDAQRVAALRAMGHDPDADLDQPEALTAQQIREMASSVDFQPHTRTHPILTQCAKGRIEEEVFGCAADLRVLTGAEPVALAYPNGAHSPDVEAIVADAGFRCAFTLDERSVTAAEDPYRFGRTFVRDEAGVPELLVLASGLHGLLASRRRTNASDARPV